VEGFMRELGIAGTVRGKVVRTTSGKETAARPADLVDRQFRCGGAQPALGRGPDLRQDLLWLDLRRFRD
jgi:hypothetical protein